MLAVDGVLLGILQGWAFTLLALMAAAAGVFAWRVLRDWWIRRGP